MNPGAIDGTINVAQDSQGFHVTMTADKFPSWELLRIPRYNTTGTYETHLFGTRDQTQLADLCTNCAGQRTDRWVG